MNLLALPASADNYIWMLHDGASAAVVDPGEAGPVHEAPDRLSLQLAAILVRHRHADPVGGVDELRARLRGPVYGPATEIIPEPVHGTEPEVAASALAQGAASAESLAVFTALRECKNRFR